MLKLNSLILFFSVTLFSTAMLADSIVLQALFNNKAMVSINGKSTMLLKDRSVKGYKLISANSYEAVIEYNGHQQRYTINGQPIQSQYPVGEKPTSLTIWPDKRGLFVTTGSINGVVAEFLVDTGASVVAMNASHARALNISFAKGENINVETASGQLLGKQVTLNAVQVGGIIVKEVSAVILPGKFPKKILLGMAFLKNVDMQREGEAILLQAKPY